MFLRSRLQVKLLNLEPSHGLITIFKNLCFTGISCLTKSANKYLYFKFKNHVVSEQTKEKKLDVFKTILRKKSNMKMQENKKHLTCCTFAQEVGSGKLSYLCLQSDCVRSV